MITRPFNFEAHVTRPPSGLDLVPFVDMCALLLFFGLMGSRFVLAPGTAVNLRLPTTPAAPSDALPTSQVLTVAEVDGREMIIFDGRILNLASLDRLLNEHRGGYGGEILLVRMDRDVSMDLLARVCELARRSGFQQVLLAAEQEPAAIPGKSVP
jgi:biopolymer transport protein ExbD